MKSQLFATTTLFVAAVFVACGGDDDAGGSPPPNVLDGGASSGDGGGGQPDASNTDVVNSKPTAMELDPSFGSGGKLTVALGSGGAPTPLGIVVQSGGGIVIAASPFDASGKGTASLFRVTSSGALDSTFQGGIAGETTDVTLGQLISGPGSDLPLLFGSPLAAPGSPVILRFLATGAPDTAFGVSGRSEKGSGGGIPVVLANGKVLNGLSGGANVTRLDAAGALDATWGASTGPLTGIASIQPITHYEFRALGPLSDGRLLVGGSVGDATKTCAVIRLGTDGSLDKPFGEVPVASDCTIVRAVLPNADGSFVVQYSATNQFALTKLTATGAPDPAYKKTTGLADPLAPLLRRADDHIIALAFGLELKSLAIWDIAPSGEPATARTLTEKWAPYSFTALQSDGKLVILGVLDNALVIARYLP